MRAEPSGASLDPAEHHGHEPAEQLSRRPPQRDDIREEPANNEHHETDERPNTGGDETDLHRRDDDRHYRGRGDDAEQRAQKVADREVDEPGDVARPPDAGDRRPDRERHGDPHDPERSTRDDPEDDCDERDDRHAKQRGRLVEGEDDTRVPSRQRSKQPHPGKNLNHRNRVVPLVSEENRDELGRNQHEAHESRHRDERDEGKALRPEFCDVTAVVLQA